MMPFIKGTGLEGRWIFIDTKSYLFIETTVTVVACVDICVGQKFIYLYIISPLHVYITWWFTSKFFDIIALVAATLQAIVASFCSPYCSNVMKTDHLDLLPHTEYSITAGTIHLDELLQRVTLSVLKVYWRYKYISVFDTIFSK